MKRVLVIEDSQTQALSIGQNFEEHNYQVVIATTGFEAYLALKDTSPDLIVLDYLLPDTNGIELCKRLKQDRLLKTIPIVMYSSENKLNYMLQAYEAGADYYVVKDEEGNKVLSLLAHSLFTRRARSGLSRSA